MTIFSAISYWQICCPASGPGLSVLGTGLPTAAIVEGFPTCICMYTCMWRDNCRLDMNLPLDRCILAGIDTLSEPYQTFALYTIIPT